MMTIQVFPVDDVAVRFRYQPRTIRELARAGRFPMPIDRELGPRKWRWSSVDLDAYAAGTWRAGQA